MQYLPPCYPFKKFLVLCVIWDFSFILFRTKKMQATQEKQGPCFNKKMLTHTMQIQNLNRGSYHPWLWIKTFLWSNSSCNPVHTYFTQNTPHQAYNQKEVCTVHVMGLMTWPLLLPFLLLENQKCHLSVFLGLLGLFLCHHQLHLFLRERGKLTSECLMYQLKNPPRR